MQEGADRTPSSPGFERPGWRVRFLSEMLRARRGISCLLSRKKPFQKGTTRKLKGDLGEAIASVVLENLGHTVIHRNWRAGRFELDLVTRQQDQLVFVEVRTRDENAQVDAFASVTKSKRKTIRNAINAYLRDERLRNKVSWRFDIVAVELKPDNSYRARHFEGCSLS